MQYVWRHRLLLHTDLVTVDGRRVCVIDPGRQNVDAGPDFFNAKVRIGDSLWAGDIEMHVRASDWHRHGHDSDPAYGSVVLHVVDRDDMPIMRANGEVIPQMVMRCDPGFHRRYSALVDRADIDLPCAAELPSIPSLFVGDWLTAMAYERAYAKAAHLAEIAARFTGDWEEATYVILARALGFGTNSEPMERLALSLPLRFLRKHSDSLTSLEALFFGQGGFLDRAPDADPYVERLRREHEFLTHKFGLRPLESPGWKMGRLRPANLPHRRIAMLAMLVSDNFRPVARMLEAEGPDEVIEMFRKPLSPYWASRYTFGPEADRTFETMSRASASVLVINVAVPLLVATGLARHDDTLIARAIDWLQQLPPENNRIVTAFATAGLRSRDAFTTQALIHVRRNYCEQRKCLYCRIGHRLLAASARRRE